MVTSSFLPLFTPYIVLNLQALFRCDHRIKDYKQALPLLGLALFKLTVDTFTILPFLQYLTMNTWLVCSKTKKKCILSPRNIDAFDTSQKQKRALNNSLCLVLTHAIGCSPKKKKEKGISLDFINPTLSEIEGCLLHFRFSLNSKDLDVFHRFFRSDRFWFLGLFSTRI